jgi:hypothetical protein
VDPLFPQAQIIVTEVRDNELGSAAPAIHQIGS